MYHCEHVLANLLSLPARGAWIEIIAPVVRCFRVMSLPARGAWIEIVVIIAAAAANSSLPARGAWIEIPPPILAQREVFGRSPQGERGLK